MICGANVRDDRERYIRYRITDKRMADGYVMQEMKEKIQVTHKEHRTML